MRRSGALLICMLSALASPLHAFADDPLPKGVVRVDGIVAVVGGLAPGPDVISILRSDVELRARISLAGAGASDAAVSVLPPALLRATFDELLGEALISGEAQRLALEAPAATDLAAERRRFVARAGGEARLASLLETLGVSPRELQAIVRRRAVVSAFLRANLEGTLEVTPSELERAYQEEDHPFRDQPFELAREPLRAWLAQLRLEQSVSKWVDSLRARTPHRVIVEY
jgi:hypothetical protein